MEFKYIKPGKFQMGSPSSEPWRAKDETQRMITISKGFYMQTTEVTKGQWFAVMKTRPWADKNKAKDDDSHPAVNMSWENVLKFLLKVNGGAEWKKRYALPTEAQWEYACRAGSTTAYSFGDKGSMLSQYGNFCDSTSEHDWRDSSQNDKYKYAAPVKSYKPNAWGLYDMHGNVNEWCQDSYGDYLPKPTTDPSGAISGWYAVVRGGSWYTFAPGCRSANRLRVLQKKHEIDLGFRLASFPKK